VHLDHFRTSHTISVPKLVQILGEATTLMLAASPGSATSADEQLAAVT
jgi:hypothetical protein